MGSHITVDLHVFCALTGNITYWPDREHMEYKPFALTCQKKIHRDRNCYFPFEQNIL